VDWTSVFRRWPPPPETGNPEDQRFKLQKRLKNKTRNISDLPPLTMRHGAASQGVRMGESECQTIRNPLSALFKRDAGLHQLKRQESIGAGYMVLRSTLRHGGGRRYQKLIVALNFWDPWILARNTVWLEHEQIPEFPRPALVVVADLDADRDITDPRVRRAFDLTATLELPTSFGLRREASVIDDPLEGFDFDDWVRDFDAPGRTRPSPGASRPIPGVQPSANSVVPQASSDAPARRLCTRPGGSWKVIDRS